MKIKLLNDGGYVGLERFNFPLEVNAELNDGYAIVRSLELTRLTGEHVRPYDYLFSESDFEVTTFDITQHEWSDFLNLQASKEQLKFDVEGCGIYFDRDDAIAIAKHFKLKAEDLC